MSLSFTKMHGLGNDFVVLEALDAPLRIDAELARFLADRRLGVGCDQVLLIEPGRDGADFGYRIYNADGSEAAHCGNGIRCVARLLQARGRVRGDRIRFALGGRIVETRLLADGQVCVDMGVPDFRPRAVPVLPATDEEATGNGAREVEVDGRVVRLVPVSMGNPHAVLMVDAVADAPVARLGPALERHSAFPERANIGFCEIRARDAIGLRVWERGAGETLACGTGACAAVAAGRRQGLLDERVTVTLAGGDLVIEWPGGDNRLWMTGPAETVFHGTLEH